MSNNEEKNWQNILRENKNFNDTLFNLRNKANNGNIVRTLIQTRNFLMGMQDVQALDFDDKNRENLQKIFLEYIPQDMYKTIVKCIRVNNWTVKELYYKCRQDGNIVIQNVSCRNIKEVA